MDEFSFIESIQQKYYRQPSLIKGIGDDGAVIRSEYQDIVAVKDMFVENIHFAKHTMQPFHIGYKALAANISDLAAMGAKPAFYLVAISIPEDWSMEAISEIFTGMKHIANQYKLDLIGGDTVTGSELVISVTALGFSNKDNTRYRSDAKEGDIVFVTGTLGDSQAGLYILNHPSTYIDEEYFVNRHQMPTPRVKFAFSLQKLSRIALNDISDGIASEANELADASRVTIVIEESKIPTHHAFDQFKPELQYQWKLFGGEDFELIGTVSKQEWQLVQEIAKQKNLQVTNIGYVTAYGQGQVLLQRKNGKIDKLEKKGYNHLSR